MIGSLTLDYTATAENIFTFSPSASAREKYDDFARRGIQLFHEHPFGQSEQHLFLKEQCDFFEDPSSARTITLMPRYAPEGELYIGVKTPSHPAPSVCSWWLWRAAKTPLPPPSARNSR